MNTHSHWCRQNISNLTHGFHHLTTICIVTLTLYKIIGSTHTFFVIPKLNFIFWTVLQWFRYESTFLIKKKKTSKRYTGVTLIWLKYIYTLLHELSLLPTCTKISFYGESCPRTTYIWFILSSLFKFYMTHVTFYTEYFNSELYQRMTPKSKTEQIKIVKQWIT